MSRVLDVDPITGLKMTLRFDHTRGEMIVGYSQDCEPILEANKRALIENNDAAQIKNDMWHYASIPTIVQMEWAQKFGVCFWKRSHQKEWMKLLNSPDYKYLKRTALHHDR